MIDYQFNFIDSPVDNQKTNNKQQQFNFTGLSQEVFKPQMSEHELTKSTIIKKQHLAPRMHMQPQPPQKPKKRTSQSSNNSKGSANCKKSCAEWFQGRRVKNLLFSWLVFIIAFFIYILIWIINFYGTQTQRSPYYLTDGFKVSPYTSIQYWNTSDIATGSVTVFSQSVDMYPNKDDLNTVGSIALQLLYSWLMWKLPLCVFTLHVVQKSRENTEQNQKKPRIYAYTTFGSFLLVLVIIDVIVAILKVDTFYDWIFYCIYTGLSLVLIIMNVYDKPRSDIQNIMMNFTLPIIYIALTIISITFFVPSIYYEIYKGASNSAAIIIVHIYPVIDLLFYLVLFGMSKYGVSESMSCFVKMLHFLNLGYAIGTWMLIGVQEVEYYYLLAYFLFRNFTMNWMQTQAYKYLHNSPILPSWIIIYLISLRLNFVPLIAVGNLVVSKSFQTNIISFTLPILRYVATGQYYVYGATSSSFPDLNDDMKTNIQIFSPFIIWAVLTFTQRYQITKITVKEVFFYIFGIYLFYIGFASGLQLIYLKQASLAS